MAKREAKAARQNELIYVIAGKEQTLTNAKCTELVDKLIAPEEKATGLWVADADKVTISEVLDELRTLPFLSKKRVVVLRNADKFFSSRGEQGEKDEKDEQDEKEGQSAPAGSTNREILEKYFDNPCPTGVLVMTVSSWSRSTRLAKKLPKVGKLIDAKPPKESELPRRLIDYAHEAYGKGLAHDAAGLLVALAGDDLPRLYTEVDKLAVYTANDKAITTTHVEALVGSNRFFNAFKVIDACLQRQPASAVQRLRKMFDEDRSAEYTTVGAFAYHFRKLFNAKKMLLEGLNEYEVVGKARIFYNKQDQFALLKRLTLEQIGGQLQQLAATDYAIKKGLAQPKIAMEQLVLKMAAM